MVNIDENVGEKYKSKESFQFFAENSVRLELGSVEGFDVHVFRHEGEVEVRKIGGLLGDEGEFFNATHTGGCVLI